MVERWSQRKWWRDREIESQKTTVPIPLHVDKAMVSFYCSAFLRWCNVVSTEEGEEKGTTLGEETKGRERIERGEGRQAEATDINNPITTQSCCFIRIMVRRTDQLILTGADVG
jgi:hypothetical protein